MIWSAKNAAVACDLGRGTAECEHVCVYSYEGRCWRIGCPVKCPSEWCPYCAGEACGICGPNHSTLYLLGIHGRCEHDVVDRHEDPHGEPNP